MGLENIYSAGGLSEGSRSKVFDSFNDSLDKNLKEAIAKALAKEVFLKNDGDPDFINIVEDTFVDHFQEVWATVELVSMEDDDEAPVDGIASLIPNAKMYYDNGMNLLLIGPHGTGKTYTIQAFCKEHGITMKYYSCSTLDPYTDLVGIPVPDGDNLRMIRPHEVDQAELIFFDEFNRADSQTMNAVFEITQFGTINGEPLPNLKCVWAAMNPADGDYTVSETDPALLDRFDAYIKMEPKPSVAYLNQFMDLKVAKALVRWWNHHETKQKNANLKKERSSYISPRRLEMLGKIWMITKSGSSIVRCLPPNGEHDHAKLIDMLETASGMKIKKESDTLKALGFDLEKGFIKNNFDAVGDSIKDDVTSQIAVIECLFNGSGPSVILEQFSPFIDKYCTAAAVETVITNLPPSKKSNIKKEYEVFIDQAGVRESLIARALSL